MSFQAYLENIQAKTGKSPDDFKKLAGKKGFTKGTGLAPGVKVADVVHWLKSDFELAACRVRVAGMGLVGLRPPSG